MCILFEIDASAFQDEHLYIFLDSDLDLDLRSGLKMEFSDPATHTFTKKRLLHHDTTKINKLHSYLHTLYEINKETKPLAACGDLPCTYLTYMYMFLCDWISRNRPLVKYNGNP